MSRLVFSLDRFQTKYCTDVICQAIKMGYKIAEFISQQRTIKNTNESDYVQSADNSGKPIIKTIKNLKVCQKET